MSWIDGDLYGFDTETGGVKVFEDRIVTGTVVKINAGELLDTRDWLINSGVPIPEEATKVHGITTEHAEANGRPPAEAIDEIATTVAGVLNSGRPLIIFNAVYDLSILEVETRRYGLTPLTERVKPTGWFGVIDAMVLGKGYEHNIKRQYVKGRDFKLPSMCERYKVPFTETHDATADAVGAVLLAVALAKKEKYFTDCTPDALHQLQVTWRREDMRSLRSYFDKKGQEHDGCDGGWPLHSRLEQVSV